jgi:hypothetical protein
MRRWDEGQRCQAGERACAAGDVVRHGVLRRPTACRRAEESVVRVAGQEERRVLLADLRTLVTYLERNPHLPVGEMTRVEVTYFPEGCDGHQEDEVVRLAGLLGVLPRREGEHYSCERRFGQAAYRVVSIPESVRTKERVAAVHSGPFRRWR